MVLLLEMVGLILQKIIRSIIYQLMDILLFL